MLRDFLGEYYKHYSKQAKIEMGTGFEFQKMSDPMIKQMGFSTLEPNLDLLLGIFHLLWARDSSPEEKVVRD